MLEIQSPFDYAITHLQALGWPAVIAGIVWAVRFINKAEIQLTNASAKFNEVHLAVTNHMTHSVEGCVTLLRKQDQRWESYLIVKSAQSFGHD
jgi:hypothetical protein